MHQLQHGIIAGRLQRIINAYWFGSYWPASYMDTTNLIDGAVSAQAQNVIWQ
jgi:hypothetical protein